MSSTPQSRTVPTSVSALMTELIDYAGLFPPASLTMRKAVENYASYAAGEFRWILGKFIVPAARLDEYEAEQRNVAGSRGFPLSVLIGAEVEKDTAALKAFSSKHHRQIDSIEAKASTEQEIAICEGLLRDYVPNRFYEVSTDASRELLSYIRDCGAAAKIRTGGVVPNAFPGTSSVAAFLMNAAEVGVRFKATAGLHHPIRCIRPLTYEPDAPTGTMHGFLNVFLAAVVARERIHIGELSERESKLRLLSAILDQDLPANFRLTDAGAQVNTMLVENGTSLNFEVNISTERIAVARRQFAVSFGSCSFEEPLEDLQHLKLL